MSDVNKGSLLTRRTDSRHVLALLAAVLDRPVKSMLIGTRACQEYRLHAVRSGGPLLAIPLRGSKRIHTGSSIKEVGPGSALLVCKDCRFDNENIPDPNSGDFLAAVLVLPEKVLRTAQGLLDQEVAVGEGKPLDVVSLEDISGPLENYLMLNDVEELSLLRHALTGLVLHLYHQGHYALLQPPKLRLADRVCELISANPAREWRSASVEGELAISGASLRRQLAMENTSLREILAEARLSQALFLLQTTRLPVKTVALRSGYSSVSSFVRRFHSRYGVEPSRVSCA